jgi:hypothetical protein
MAVWANLLPIILKLQIISKGLYSLDRAVDRKTGITIL